MTTPAILRRSMPLTALVTVLASLAACSPEVAEGDADPGDLPAWGDSVTLVEEVRIGSLDGPLIDESQLQMYYARVDESGQPERLAAMPAEDREGPRYVLSGRGGYYRPMVTMNVSTVGPDGAVYWVRNDEYRIRRLSADGDTTELVREEPRIELTDDELREWNARSESMAERSPEMRDQFFPIPTVKPYIRDLAVDADGRLWVSRYTHAVYVPYTPEEAADREEQGLPNYNWRETLTWDVWSPDGSFLGTVTLPHKTSFSTASGNEVWGVQQGSFREDYVVRWRLEFGN